MLLGSVNAISDFWIVCHPSNLVRMNIWLIIGRTFSSQAFSALALLVWWVGLMTRNASRADRLKGNVEKSPSRDAKTNRSSEHGRSPPVR